MPEILALVGSYNFSTAVLASTTSTGLMLDLLQPLNTIICVFHAQCRLRYGQKRHARWRVQGGHAT